MSPRKPSIPPRCAALCFSLTNPYDPIVRQRARPRLLFSLRQTRQRSRPARTATRIRRIRFEAKQVLRGDFDTVILP
jgi:hypothetical protein